jgi:hypothetical protein
MVKKHALWLAFDAGISKNLGFPVKSDCVRLVEGCSLALIRGHGPQPAAWRPEVFMGDDSVLHVLLSGLETCQLWAWRSWL